jgi:putative heme-binding domain-containing protein
MLRFLLLLTFQSPQAPAADLEEIPELGLRIARGFQVRLYSGPEIANDIYNMTLDSRGQVVVTSQGWIKILHGAPGGLKAERATVFAKTATGGMGMCFDGNDLLFSGDQGFWRFRDSAGRGEADGPPERLGRFVSGEHGHHAIRKGPDGWWYLMGGNDAGISKAHVTLPNSPIRDPQAGALLRYAPDFSGSEVIAHGFRNAYDFDFNEKGDLFTYDSDCERDFFLPWYTPTRMYHVGLGESHGWRLKGYLRSFARPDYSPDTVSMLWPVGRGSPTGVVCYRHTRFPERYQGGIFALDWTFGKIYFFPLRPEGASYTTRPEIFLEPCGTEGFAPTAACVAPDGSLFISIGGRRTRGSVFRIDAKSPILAPEPATDLLKVLRAPQPLVAWSRARWEPRAASLKALDFEGAVLAVGSPVQDRVRAVEILTERMGGLRKEIATLAAGQAAPEVRARVAWSLGRVPTDGGDAVLWSLVLDPNPRVRREALESLAAHPGPGNSEAAAPWLRSNFVYPDKRVRQAAARLGALLPPSLLASLEPDPASPQLALTAALAELERGDPQDRIVDLAVAGLSHSKDAGERLQGVRLIIRGLGDTQLEQPAIEIHSNYAPARPPSPPRRERILQSVRPIFPSEDPELSLEASRLLAMVEDEDPRTLARAATFISEQSSPTSDLHYLVVLSRLGGSWPETLAPRMAGALLSLDRKLEGQEQRSKQTWGSRLGELTQVLVQRHPDLGPALLGHPALPRPAHVEVAAHLPPPERLLAARLFLAAATKDSSFAWSEALLRLFSVLPPEELGPALRAQWANFGMRDAIVTELARTPQEVDRGKFLAGVEASNPQVVRLSLEALDQLEPKADPEGLVSLLRVLRRLILEPKERALRARVVGAILRESGESRPFKEESTDPLDLKRLYQPLFDEFLKAHPAMKSELEGGGEDFDQWRPVLAKVAWEKGEAARGEAIFRARGCQTCHAVQGALGPNLSGAASRFSRDDLFEAIVNPSKDVAPPYRTTIFQMKDGQVYTGIIAFESADGYILQTGATTTVRLNTPDIAASRPGSRSLMPDGLLKDLGTGDLADLYAYLRSLGK